MNSVTGQGIKSIRERGRNLGTKGVFKKGKKMILVTI